MTTRHRLWGAVAVVIAVVAAAGIVAAVTGLHSPATAVAGARPRAARSHVAGPASTGHGRRASPARHARRAHPPRHQTSHGSWLDVGQPCPGPQPLVRSARWTSHRLAPGVTLQEGTARDRTVSGGPGVVDLHVLRVDTTRPAVSLRPLVRAWSVREPLSRLASGRRGLVAATNTGLFDFDPAGPLGPVFAGRRPGSIGATWQRVIGLSASGRVEPGRARLAGHVVAGGRQMAVTSYDVLHPRPGLALYTPRWGRTDLPFARTGVVLRRGRVAAAAAAVATVHRGEQVLLAESARSQRFLAGMRRGQGVIEHVTVRTSAKAPMVQGYAVAKPLLLSGGRPGAWLGCNERDSQAARTAVGFAHHGRQLIVVVVADHPQTPLHGLDQKEMVAVMRDLGADRAWEWDGSGSSELMARMPRTGRLSIRNYCADSVQRPMPVGLGVFVRRPGAAARHR